MTSTNLLSSLFPSARRPPTARQWWSLIAFLALFAGLCIWLDRAGLVLFAAPERLGWIVLAGWVWWLSVAGYAGLPAGRRVLALWFRWVLLAVLVMALAEPRAVRSRDVVSLMYVIDVSDSIGEAGVDRALGFASSTWTGKRPQDEVGLVIFGGNAAVELPPRTSYPYEALNSQIERGATNLEQALSLAAAMLPDENQGRLVLISDGVQTEGSPIRLLDELRSRQIPVDVLPISYTYEREVWLERLDLPQNVKLGESYEAAVVLSALTPGRGKLVLKENGQTIAEQPVEYLAGKNRYTFPIQLRAAGYYEYTASIEVSPEQDRLTANNGVLNYISVMGEGRVLLVVDPRGSKRDWELLDRAIREAERATEVLEADNFPRDPISLTSYDCIVFVNVGHDQFDALQLQAAHDAVYNLGIGFLMVGGPNSFGPGGYHRTSIEDLLPVSMDVTQKKILPKGALAIILHSCEFPEGNTWAKRITKQAIKVLSGQDEVGVLAYLPEGEGWVFEMTKASRYEELVPLINGAQIGDMPSFQNTMRLGYEALKKSDAAAKHMIIVSDGDPSPPQPALVQQFKEAQISVSMVAVFPHGGLDISSMQAVASILGGRYYKPEDPAQLPAIFIKESKTLKRTMIQNQEFVPEIDTPLPVIKGIEQFPPLGGYVLTSIKNKALQVLQTPPDPKQPEEARDPVLAVWQYGLGKSAAFTSDFSAKWGARWQSWDRFQPFIKQLMTELARVSQDTKLRLTTDTQGGESLIIAEDFATEERFLDVKARVAGPKGRVESVSLKQVGPRRYQLNMPLWGHGRYQVSVKGSAGGVDEQAYGGFVVPYSPEYLRFRSNRQLLNDIAERTGGRAITPDITPAELFSADRKVRRTSRPIFDWFLIALGCLIPIDVALRRVQLDFSSLRSLFIRKPQASTATLGTLLQRKQQVGAVLDSARADGPRPQTAAGAVTAARRENATTAATTIPGSAQPPGSAKSPGVVRPPGASGPAGGAGTGAASGGPPASPPAAKSTTERLLELKRKKQQDGNG